MKKDKKVFLYGGLGLVALFGIAYFIGHKHGTTTTTSPSPTAPGINENNLSILQANSDLSAQPGAESATGVTLQGGVGNNGLNSNNNPAGYTPSTGAGINLTAINWPLWFHNNNVASTTPSSLAVSS